MRKKIEIAALTLLITLLVAVGLWFLVRPAYRGHKEKRAVAQARAFLAKQDYRNASISARQALEVNPNNVEACEMMARLAEVVRAPQVLDWRRRIADISPTVEHKLQLASAALRNQPPPYALAAQTLDEVSGSATNFPAYHVIRAEMALKLRRPADAEAAFSEASRLEPTNAMHQLNLSVLRLQSTNDQVSAAARSTLERLRGSTNLAAIALRWLVADRLSHRDLRQAGKYSEELLRDPAVALDDRLQHLEILRLTNQAEFDSCLATVQQGCLTNATALYSVSAWMISHGMPRQTLEWITNLPPKIRAEQPAPMAAVDCYVALKDWAGLGEFLQEAAWGELEFLRFAFLSRAADEQKETVAAEGHWRNAVRHAGDRLGPLNSLYTMAASWGRTEEQEALLWKITQRFPKEKWAFRELIRHYTADNSTPGLNKVYAAMMGIEPENVAVKNNFAATSLLLGQNVPRAHEVAREVYGKLPQDPVVASTYAWSLSLQGKAQEACAIMNRLKPAELEQPGIALYYGAVLFAAGETNQAASFLKLAQKGTFLPEEKKLLQDLGKGIGR